jgi:phosphatidylglycerophosphate synthase
LTWISFGTGTLAAALILLGQIGWSMVMIVLALILDGLDGMVARRYKLVSRQGETLDNILDPVIEITLFLAIAVSGYGSIKLAVLASLAVILIRLLRKRAGFDPGFKRVVLIFGYFTNFNLALQIIFVMNLVGYIIQMLIVDYRYQIVLDKKS